MDADARRGLLAEGLDPDDPQVVEAIDLVHSVAQLVDLHRRRAPRASRRHSEVKFVLRLRVVNFRSFNGHRGWLCPQ